MQNQNIKVFENEQFGKIRVVEKNNEPWFIAKDVCKALGLAQVSRAIQKLDEDEVTNSKVIDSIGHEQKVNAISEAGMYSLVLVSRKPEAKAFKRWVTHEVLPAIRRTGGYMVTKADDTPEEIMARAVLIAQDTINRQKQQIADMQPKALFADAVAASHTSILVGELAKLLKQNGVDIGQNRLFRWLRENGYLMKTGSSYNMPTQRSMEQELFEVKETSITHSDGHITVQKTPKVTGKGQQYFINRFLTKGEVA